MFNKLWLIGIFFLELLYICHSVCLFLNFSLALFTFTFYTVVKQKNTSDSVVAAVLVKFRFLTIKTRGVLVALLYSPVCLFVLSCFFSLNC